ncbi:MAG: hypothetical protein JWN70_6483 [Planctomycetaceae bacterium]|nr:hypothetical protein [Planctomycetaceae bacterium]
MTSEVFGQAGWLSAEAIRFTPPAHVFIPFEIGPRNCIGASCVSVHLAWDAGVSDCAGNDREQLLF